MSLIIALFVHLLIMGIISFTIPSTPPGKKPPMSFLGSILDQRDFFIAEPFSLSQRAIPPIDQHRLSGEAQEKHFYSPQTPNIKPPYFGKGKDKNRMQFKPPKELFIADHPPQHESDESDLGINMTIPPRTPLKLSPQ